MVSINWHDFKWHWKWKTNGYDLTDVQKAFDTKDHEILLAKMKCIGFSDKIKCFHSYLTSRAFSISELIVFLKVRTINCWVSQGSILRPLLFLLYINEDLCCVCYIEMIFCRLCLILMHTCMQATQVDFINIRRLQKLKMF